MNNHVIIFFLLLSLAISFFRSVCSANMFSNILRKNVVVSWADYNTASVVHRCVYDLNDFTIVDSIVAKENQIENQIEHRTMHCASSKW